MSIHKSLVSRGKLKRHRNVLSRLEQLTILTKEEKWKEGDSIFGLPKVRHILQKTKSKAKKEAEAAAAVEGEAAATEAVPATSTPASPAGKQTKSEEKPTKGKGKAAKEKPAKGKSE